MTVTLQVAQGVAEITLNRPSAHNALDAATKVAFLDAATAAGADRQVRAVLIAAEGKNFCVGQDLAQHVEALNADASTAMNTVDEHYNPLIRAIAALQVPVVVAINGACVGAGWGIALAGDVRIAGAGTSFATAFSGIGLAADSGLSYQLATNLGVSRAKSLLLLGTKVTAEQALDWGLVHQVTADDEVRATGLALARKLAAGPTAAYGEIKSLVDAAAAGLDAALDREFASQARLGASADHHSAVAAFLAKEKPVFVGR